MKNVNIASYQGIAVKTMIRYPLTHQCDSWGCREKGDFFFALLGMYISAATVENSVEISLKTRDEIAIWSSSTTTGYTPERDELVGWKRHLY